MYEVKINFEEAAAAWMSNKVKCDNCTYYYICGCITKTNGKCRNRPSKNSKNGYCGIHKRKGKRRGVKK